MRRGPRRGTRSLDAGGGPFFSPSTPASESRTGPRVPTTAVAPASKKAQARRSTPSPLRTAPPELLQAERTTIFPRRWSAAISGTVSRPSSPCADAGWGARPSGPVRSRPRRRASRGGAVKSQQDRLPSRRSPKRPSRSTHGFRVEMSARRARLPATRPRPVRRAEGARVRVPRRNAWLCPHHPDGCAVDGSARGLSAGKGRRLLPGRAHPVQRERQLTRIRLIGHHPSRRPRAWKGPPAVERAAARPSPRSGSHRVGFED